MRTVGAYEAKTRLSQLLDDVADRGETIVITKNEKPVAELRPITRHTDMTPRQAIEALRKLRLKLGGLSIRSLIDEGRRR